MAQRLQSDIDDLDPEELWEEEEEEEEGDEEDEDDESESDDTTDDGDEDDDDTPLGPKGEKALQAEKQKRRDAQKQLREWKALGMSPADIKKLLDDRNDGDQPDPDRIRSEAKAEAQAELMESRVLDKIEAKAGKLFADPDDAAALLMKDHGADEFLDDGKIDVEAIEEALDELLEKKPYLAAQGGRRFQGSADGGTRKESRTKQLTRDDLKRMSPQEIEQARKDGKLDDLLSGKKS